MRLFLHKLILLTLTVALFVACTKNEDPKPPVYFLSKVTTDISENEYTYDGEKATGLTNSVGGTKVTGTFTYDGNGDIIDITFSNNVIEEFTYLNGNITGRKRYDATRKLLSQWDYEYSGSQLVKVQFYDVGDGIAYSSLFRVYEYDDTSDDPARVKEFSKHTPTTPSITSVYTYGQAKDAFSAAPAALKKYLRLLRASTEKNVVKIVDDTTTFIYTYEFNDQDNPTKRVETLPTGQAYTTTYEYKLIN